MRISRYPHVYVLWGTCRQPPVGDAEGSPSPDPDASERREGWAARSGAWSLLDPDFRRESGHSPAGVGSAPPPVADQAAMTSATGRRGVSASGAKLPAAQPARTMACG